MGAPVAVRTTSTWAGGWAGVCTLSDYPSQSLQLPWQGMEFSSGRMMASQHFIHGHPLTHVCLYGYPRSPTWPRASWLTQQLLDVVTNEIVIGASGCRVVVGDFNHSPQALASFDTWRAYGWRSAQDWAYEMFGQPVQMTCKGRTETELIWLSLWLFLYALKCMCVTTSWSTLR